MKSSRIIAAFTVAITIFAAAGNTANAQTTFISPEVNQQIIGQPQQAIAQPQQIQGGQFETRVAPEALVIAPPSAPKLGFTGQIVPGLGMKVLSVRPGSPAANAGLEYGDIVMTANGFPITQQYDLSNALSNAASYTNGVVNLRVKNIRGCIHRGDLYVTVTAYLYGQPVPVAINPIPVVQN